MLAGFYCCLPGGVSRCTFLPAATRRFAEVPSNAPAAALCARPARKNAQPPSSHTDTGPAPHPFAHAYDCPQQQEDLLKPLPPTRLLQLLEEAPRDAHVAYAAAGCAAALISNPMWLAQLTATATLANRVSSLAGTGSNHIAMRTMRMWHTRVGCAAALISDGNSNTSKQGQHSTGRESDDSTHGAVRQQAVT